jgi:hypothetical protein
MTIGDKTSVHICQCNNNHRLSLEMADRCQNYSMLDYKEGSCIPQEQKIRCHAFARFIRYSRKSA